MDEKDNFSLLNETETKPTDVVSAVGESADVTLKAQIERNKEFNAKLEAEKLASVEAVDIKPIPKPKPVEPPVETNPDKNYTKLNQIKAILRYGMDSQQQEKALVQIKEVLEN